MEGEDFLPRAPSLVQSRTGHAGQVLQAPAAAELRTFRPSLAGRNAFDWSRELLATNARANRCGSTRSGLAARGQAVADQCPWAKKRGSALWHVRQSGEWYFPPSLLASACDSVKSQRQHGCCAAAFGASPWPL